jgi:hypothetical protein
LEIRKAAASSISAAVAFFRVFHVGKTERVHGHDGLTEGDQRIGIEAGLTLPLRIEDRSPCIGFFGR